MQGKTYLLSANLIDVFPLSLCHHSGFFKPHRDFTSMVSNMVEEFSCIICVTPEKEFTKGVEGGQVSACWLSFYI